MVVRVYALDKEKHTAPCSLGIVCDVLVCYLQYTGSIAYSASLCVVRNAGGGLDVTLTRHPDVFISLSRSSMNDSSDMSSVRGCVEGVF